MIQRDEQSEEKTPIMYYSKLPPDVKSFTNVLLVDPMLATGGSVLMAIKVPPISVIVDVAPYFCVVEIDCV